MNITSYHCNPQVNFFAHAQYTENWVCPNVNMASKELYEPATRVDHISFVAEEKVYLWSGLTQDGSEDGGIKLATCIEQFDPYLEVWSQVNTAGTPHPGLEAAACASSGEHVYMYGGFKGRYNGVLSCLDLKSLAWSQLSAEGGTAGGPMRKTYCGMVHFHHDKLAVIGGHGFPTGPTQLGSTFIVDTDEPDGRGWTNEVHVFDLSQGIIVVTCMAVEDTPYSACGGHFDNVVKRFNQYLPLQMYF